MALATLEAIDTLQTQEHHRILHLAHVETTWYKETDKYYDRSQAEAACEQGVLVHVPAGDHHILNRVLRERVQPDLLRPRALVYMQYILDLWYKVNGSTDIKFAVTSLYRDGALQQAIINSAGGYRALAVSETSHTTGCTFDLGANSCYLQDPLGKIEAIQKHNPDTAHKFRQGPFNDLQAVLRQEALNDGCNFVVEHTVLDGSLEPSVYHICVAP